MYFLLTNDVENFPNPIRDFNKNGSMDIYKIGLPRLLSSYSKYDIESTFYFTGEMAETFPESVDLVEDHGHEIGCHGYSHLEKKSLDLLKYEEQVIEIKKSKKLLESISGKIESFRAPNLRFNNDTIRALEETGFTSDSSMCSQRFDGPMTFFSKRKLKWLWAPRKPYFLRYNEKRNTKILEIPISALFFSFSGVVMRRSPSTIKLLQKYLFFEASYINKPIVFVFHPYECLDQNNMNVLDHKSNSYLIKAIMQKLKMNNMGLASMKLLDDLLRDARKMDVEFITIKEYRRLIKEV